MVPAADASTQTVAAAWLEKQPHPDGLPETLDEFCSQFLTNLDKQEGAEAWAYLKSVGKISPITQAFVESRQYAAIVPSVETYRTELPNGATRLIVFSAAIRRAERLHAIRNGLADYQDVQMGYDMRWRQNLDDDEDFSQTFDFRTISAFSVISDFILLDSDNYDRSWSCPMSENCMHWLRLLVDNKVICATEFFAVRDAFMHVREDWHTPVNIPVIRASE